MSVVGKWEKYEAPPQLQESAFGCAGMSVSASYFKKDVGQPNQVYIHLDNSSAYDGGIRKPGTQRAGISLNEEEFAIFRTMAPTITFSGQEHMRLGDDKYLITTTDAVKVQTLLQTQGAGRRPKFGDNGELVMSRHQFETFLNRGGFQKASQLMKSKTALKFASKNNVQPKEIAVKAAKLAVEKDSELYRKLKGLLDEEQHPTVFGTDAVSILMKELNVDKIFAAVNHSEMAETARKVPYGTLRDSIAGIMLAPTLWELSDALHSELQDYQNDAGLTIDPKEESPKRTYLFKEDFSNQEPEPKKTKVCEAVEAENGDKKPASLERQDQLVSLDPKADDCIIEESDQDDGVMRIGGMEIPSPYKAPQEVESDENEDPKASNV